jgi:hypothetical protein
MDSARPRGAVRFTSRFATLGSELALAPPARPGWQPPTAVASYCAAAGRPARHFGSGTLLSARSATTNVGLRQDDTDEVGRSRNAITDHTCTEHGQVSADNHVCSRTRKSWWHAAMGRNFRRVGSSRHPPPWPDSGCDWGSNGCPYPAGWTTVVSDDHPRTHTGVQVGARHSRTAPRAPTTTLQSWRMALMFNTTRPASRPSRQAQHVMADQPSKLRQHGSHGP